MRRAAYVAAVSFVLQKCHSAIITPAAMIPTTVPFVVDAHLALPGVDVKVLTFAQRDPFTAVFESTRHTLCMSLTPQVTYSSGAYLDADGSPGTWLQFGDVNYGPIGTRMRVTAPGVACYRAVYCSFDAAVFAETTGLDGHWSRKQLMAAIDVRAPTIKRDLYRVVQEISEAGFGRERLIGITARLALAEVVRYLHDEQHWPVTTQRSALATWQLRRIRDYVEGMVDRHPTVDELARICGIGRRQLMRAYKATTGRTIGEYVAEVRMTKARSLLAETSLSQKEIAYRLGFAGPSSFCAAFGKAAGMTPKQFRNRHRSG